MNNKLDKLASALILLWIGIEVGRSFGRDVGYMEAVSDAIDSHRERAERGEIDRYGEMESGSSRVYNRGWSAEVIIGGIGIAVVIIIVALYFNGR